MRKMLRRITRPFRKFGEFVARRFKPIQDFFFQEPEEAPLGDSIQLAFEQPQGMLEHLAALRRHIFRSLVVFFVAAGAAYIFLDDLLAWITVPIGGIDQLRAVEVTEPIGVAMRVVVLAGFALALPYITMEIFLFIAPALSRRARVGGLLAIPLVVAFFFGGMAFAYYFILPTGLPVLLNFLPVPTEIRPSSYMRFVTGLMFWIGLVFEFPLVSYLLASLGVISARTLLNNWRIAVVIMAVLAAVITPTIDPINMMLVMGPLLVLYGFSVVLSLLAGGRRRRSRERAEMEG